MGRKKTLGTRLLSIMSSSACNTSGQFKLYNLLHYVHMIVHVYHPSEPISLHHGRSSGSLDDIMLEDDTDLHKELDDFFGSEAEVSQKLLRINYQ